MSLTVAQLQALKANALANTAVVPAGQPWTSRFTGIQVKDVYAQTDSDAAACVAGWYNQDASPAWVVWKRLVSIGDVGKTFDATELAGLTSLNTQRLQNLAAWLAGGVNPSTAAVRQFFADIFSGAGGTNTRAALTTLWQENASFAEKIFSSGLGTTASPSTCDSNVGQNFQLSTTDVNNSRTA